MRDIAKNLSDSPPKKRFMKGCTAENKEQQVYPGTAAKKLKQRKEQKAA